jgi:TolA-binding protein
MENQNTQTTVVEKKKLTEQEMKTILDNVNSSIVKMTGDIETLEKQLDAKRKELVEKQAEVKDVAKKWIAIQNKKYGIDEPKVRKSGGGRPKKSAETKTETPAEQK